MCRTMFRGLLRRRLACLAALLIAAALPAACAPTAGSREAGPGRKPADVPDEAQSDGVEITYIGNEGFLVASGEIRVLVDALYREGVDGYLVHPPELREKLESAAPPFDGVDLILATHDHDDHFDAGAVAAHLKASPESLFVSTPQAVEKLRAGPGWDGLRERVREIFPAEGEKVVVEHRGVRVSVLNLHHGRGRPIQNLGFLIEIGGRKLLHAGDTEATLEDLAPSRLAEADIDIGLIPYWYLSSPSLRRAVLEAIAPRRLVPIHIPSPDAPASWFGDDGSLAGLLGALEKAHPGAVIFRKPLERHTF